DGNGSTASRLLLEHCAIRSRSGISNLAFDLFRGLVFTQGDEARMPQVIVRRPLTEFELPDKDRFQPAAILHFRGGEPLTPAPAALLGEIDERACGGFKRAEFLHQLRAQSRRKAVAGSRRIEEARTFVIAEDQGIERAAAERVAADHEFLPFVHAHLLPCAGSLTGLVVAVAAFGDEPFKALLFHGANEIA